MLNADFVRTFCQIFHSILNMNIAEGELPFCTDCSYCILQEKFWNFLCFSQSWAQRFLSSHESYFLHSAEFSLHAHAMNACTKGSMPLFFWGSPQVLLNLIHLFAGLLPAYDDGLPASSSWKRKSTPKLGKNDLFSFARLSKVHWLCFFIERISIHSLFGWGCNTFTPWSLFAQCHLCSCPMWDHKERPFISPKTCSISSQCIKKQALYTQLSRIQRNVQSA